MVLTGTCGGRRGGALPGVLATLALLVSLAALFLTIFREPLGPVQKLNWNALGTGVEGYDFTTPADAYKSQLRIEEKRDIRALMEVSRRTQAKALNEQIDTLEIKKEVDLKLPVKKRARSRTLDLPRQKKDASEKGGKMREIKLLFVTYLKDGEQQYEVKAMEKHDDTGWWMATFVSSYTVADTNKELARKMRDWEEKGSDK
jgi:hypothetical protein